MNLSDPLWLEFKTLWRVLQAADPSLLLAGGYGLFLKQIWLTQHAETPIIVSLERWKDTTARVTKDLDFIISLDLIGEQNANELFAQILNDNGYVATVRNPRWQFEKALSEERTITVDLHAATGAKLPPSVVEDRIRVKHKPSLGDAGVQARKNPEAAGCDRHPFQFMAEELTIRVPNPVSWAIMKLTAMRDTWSRSMQADRSESGRNYWRSQAGKHAQDACRVIAMVTRDEIDLVSEVSRTLLGEEPFHIAQQIFYEYFGEPRGAGVQMVETLWTAEDFELIQGTLNEWFH